MTVRIGPIASERDGGTAERLAGATWNNAKDRPNPRDDPRGVGLRDGDDQHGGVLRRRRGRDAARLCEWV